MSCPFHKVRSDLPPLNPRIAALPVDERGYPVPFFVAYIDGKPEFRIADAQKKFRCLTEHLCWVCGQKLEQSFCFVIGPMCSITRTTAEPACHPDCGEWSATGCPFLTKPNMVRRPGEIIEQNKGNVAGVMVERNPGVTCVWHTKSYELFTPDPKQGPLITVGEPTAVTWYREGRPATRHEVGDSMKTGLPLLAKECQSENDLYELKMMFLAASAYIPD